MNLILSTCGTSILTNKAEEHLGELLTRHANARQSSDVQEERDSIERHIRAREQAFAGLSREAAKKHSAELNGILSFYGEPFAANPQDVHYLLTTDTWLGEATAKIVKSWLNNNGFPDVRIQRHSDLQTADWQLFRSSLADLVKWCNGNIAPQRTKHCRIIFNLSGGFKSETGFLQMLGMFYADETVYMFERSGELMRIPRLPIKMEDEEEVRKDLCDFRRASLGLKVFRGKSGIYWFEIDGECGLTPWGELVFAQHKAVIYQQKIHPEPSGKMIYSNKFLKSCERESAARKQQINEQIDAFAKFLEDKNQPNPGSLHFHPVQAHPQDDRVTHEIYAWSDGSAKRIYCRQLDDGKVKLCFLGAHL